MSLPVEAEMGREGTGGNFKNPVKARCCCFILLCITCRINSVDLKNRLGDIETDLS